MNSISAEEFKERLSSLNILDIRTPDEIEEFDLGGIHIPFESLFERMEAYETLKNQEVIVICYTGLQSKIAVTILSKKGFVGVKNLEGGIEAFLSL
ncbi:rhodanese-like domain-containing protein [Flectobacillus major]|jgi:adenylyltransferase/sulfurtransferase|uniref:rhodanese-like domain-containing protein n=1 Tax=Flectobacillus major TaxID=103 RepID=UPI0004176296|nr:rhodanese-like domain-containing protein [Flectobacillus major]